MGVLNGMRPPPTAIVQMLLLLLLFEVGGGLKPGLYHTPTCNCRPLYEAS